jgi:hypothetical protein
VEATRLLAQQTVMDKVSDTIMRERIDHMEKELDGVEKIEDTLEGMIGRLVVARELLELEISKVDACGQLLSQLSASHPNDATIQIKQNGMSQTKKEIDVKEMLILQNLIGIRNPDDIQKIQQKGFNLEKDFYESGLQTLQSTMDETYFRPFPKD